MKNAEEIKIEIPSGTLAALAWGPEDGQPILALHGWLDNAASFLPIAKYFSDFRFIAIDMMGHGHSVHPPKGIYFHFIDYVADVAAVIDKMGWKTCGLLGHSLGAGVASILTGVLNDRIRALGLVDGIGPITIEEQQFPDLLSKGLHDYAHVSTKKIPIYESVKEAVQARLTVSKMRQESVELLVERGTKKTHDGITWSTDQRLTCSPLIMYTESQIPHFLKRIHCNTCLIRPSHGWPFDEKVFANRIRYLDNVEVHRVRGEHHVHMDHPETVGPILQDFFSRSL